jgi:hypothetical protein
MMHAGSWAGPQSVGNSSRASSFPEHGGNYRCNFWHFSYAAEPRQAISVCYRGTAEVDKIPASIRHFPLKRHRGDFHMTLTVAHISPIISVIAGLLILIMPRLLNLIVAIFLIVNGLIGLGLLKWLHM